jgi:hypothetical protein
MAEPVEDAIRRIVEGLLSRLQVGHHVVGGWRFLTPARTTSTAPKTYNVTLPKGIPEANFWSFTAYDNQTRSMLDTLQRYPRAARVIRRSPPNPMSTAPRRSISG